MDLYKLKHIDKNSILLDKQEIILTQLRDRTTDIADFRLAAHQLANVLAGHVVNVVPATTKSIETPLGVKYDGKCFAENIVLVPILRSGLVLLPAFLSCFPYATVGCVGLKRDEETAEPKQYYVNIPKIGLKDRIIFLDPMIATGGSSVAALDIFKKLGVTDDRMTFAAVIAAREGLARLQKAAPRMNIIVTAVDEKLNENFFIEPGLGDFGDRYFGTL